ncbi:hypothetical protein M5D96_012962 [Drosophila gunungcola]|uniref:Uncharacterized protein n=1 Tax=Drosophila gunungcola TaxID=103775 RepID=A0A9Q0BJL6_9MUSC|nr:hypothetical protein M5D96_012962 [Drosophila gunungcola]
MPKENSKQTIPLSVKKAPENGASNQYGDRSKRKRMTLQ